MKPWIKRTLFGVFGVSLLVGALSGCGHRHPGGSVAQMSAQDAAKWRERLIDWDVFRWCLLIGVVLVALVVAEIVGWWYDR